MNPQAIELNQLIQQKNATVYDLLSEKGKAAFFPKSGILGQTAQAKGKKINATIGAAIEDDGTPMRLQSIASKVDLDPAKIFPYAPSYGRPDLRQKWQSMIVEKNPTLKGKEISLPVVTNALTHGLSILGQMFFDVEEKVVLSDLFWGNYNLVFKQPYAVQFDVYNTFKNGALDVDALEKKLLDGAVEKKVVLLNFPNNPTGYSPTRDEAKTIIAIIKRSADQGSKLLVILDDAYFGLVYNQDVYKESLFAELADLHENVLAVKVDGSTKEDYVWGFRVGFVTYGIKGGDKEIYSALEAKTAGLIRGNISNAPNISQSLLLEAYSSPDYAKEKQEKGEILKSRYEAVASILNKKSEYAEYFTPLPFNSGYFMCVQLKEGIDGEVLRNLLLDEYSTGVIWAAGVIRLAYSAVPESLIAELFDNLYKACKKLV